MTPKSLFKIKVKVNYSYNWHKNAFAWLYNCVIITFHHLILTVLKWKKFKKWKQLDVNSSFYPIKIFLERWEVCNFAESRIFRGFYRKKKFDTDQLIELKSDNRTRTFDWLRFLINILVPGAFYSINDRTSHTYRWWIEGSADCIKYTLGEMQMDHALLIKDNWFYSWRWQQYGKR